MSNLNEMFSTDSIISLEKSVRFAETRHRYILGNIANADTPGYQRQDLSRDAFDAELKRAIVRQRRNPEAGFQFDKRRGYRLQRSGRATSGLRSTDNHESVAGVLRHDGNNVDIEREMALLTKNSGGAMQAVSLLRKLLGQIRSVAQDA